MAGTWCVSSYVIAGQCKAQGQGANFLVGETVLVSEQNHTTLEWPRARHAVSKKPQGKV